MLNLLTVIRPHVNKTSKRYTSWMLEQHLPVLAVRWFVNVERITGGLIKLKFNPDEAQTILKSKKRPESELARSIKIANSQWNVLWAGYTRELTKSSKSASARFLTEQLENVIGRNTRFLLGLNAEPVIITKFNIIKQTNLGFDLIAGDLVANSYTDKCWGGLIEGLDNFTSFREKYVKLTYGEKILREENTAAIARAGALAEIVWADELVNIETGIDMWVTEYIYKFYGKTTFFDKFPRAANLAGANIPELSSKQIIYKIRKNPDVPIEEILK